MITFDEKTHPHQITAWLHRQIAAQSPQHAAMVAAYREGRTLPDDQLPAVTPLRLSARYGQNGGTA